MVNKLYNPVTKKFINDTKSNKEKIKKAVINQRKNAPLKYKTEDQDNKKKMTQLMEQKAKMISLILMDWEPRGV